MRLRGEHTRIEATGSEANTRICQLYWDIRWWAGSELEIVSVWPGFSLSVEHASSVWQAMKIYVRISKLPVEMQMEDMPSI